MTARGKTRRSRSINFHRRGCTRAFVCTLLLLASRRHETDGAYIHTYGDDESSGGRTRRKVFSERKEERVEKEEKYEGTDR